MKSYKEIYINHYSFCKDEVILCENCGAVAVDIHHITFKSQLGKDNIENLIALCRECHAKAHNDKMFNNILKELEFLGNF